VYGLHPLLPIKYLLPSRPGENKDPQLVRVLPNQLSKLEKLLENRLIAQDLVISNQWNRSLWSQNWLIKTKFQFGDYVLWFPRAVSKHALKFQRQWFGPYRIQYCLPNNYVLLVIIDKFDPNPVLVNINKLKPYKFIEDRTLQPILAKLSDLVTDEPVQTDELEPLLIELEDLQPIEFELVNNHFTHGSIEGTYVLVHYHDVPNQNNLHIIASFLCTYNRRD
jgi:hypothetical protein